MSGASHVVFRIEYARYSELRDDVSQQMARGGLLVKVHDASTLTLDSPVALELVLPDGTRLQDTGKVLQVFAGFGVAVSVGAELVEQARRAASGLDLPGAGAARHERIDLAGPGLRRTPASSRTMEPLAPLRSSRTMPPLATPRSSRTIQPLATPRSNRTIQPLAPDGDPEPDVPRGEGPTRADKIQQALHGTRDERNAILRDRDRTLHPFVLKNPQLATDDVVTIAKNSQVTPDLLKQICERKDWFQRPAIALAIARNPKTPPDLAVRALEHVPVEALRQMAKGVGVLPHVTHAARKKILG